jgi:hypothetical protein
VVAGIYGRGRHSYMREGRVKLRSGCQLLFLEIPAINNRYLQQKLSNLYCACSNRCFYAALFAVCRQVLQRIKTEDRNESNDNNNCFADH